MKKNSLIIIVALIGIFLLSSSFMLHTYYVSICSIEYVESDKAFELSFKFTAHDIEKAIKNESKIDLHLGEKNEFIKSDSLLNDYISSNFKIKTTSDLQLVYVGKEFKMDETLWVYLEVKNVINSKELEIENTLLIETFRGQKNIVHYKKQTKTNSYSFNRRNTNYTFTTK